MEKTEARWADADGVRIAYQELGGGPRTVVGIGGFAQHLGLVWERREPRKFFSRLGSVCRLVHFDKRGTGLSDRGVPPPSLDARVRDITAVMDAAGVKRAVLGGFSEGAALAAFFAATYPQRVDGLMLSGGFATWTRTADHPWAPTVRQQRTRTRFLRSVWGTGLVSATMVAPSMAHRPSFWRWARTYERAAIDRSDVVAYSRLNLELDIRWILDTIQAPTLVMHAQGDRVSPVRSGRYLAEHIRGARFVELPTSDHALWFGAQDVYLDAIEGFLRWRTDITPVRARLLSTVLFTDIVGSTRRASQLGDARWMELLERHDALVRAEVERHAGHWIKSTGDGMLATFDSPAGAIRCADRLRTRLASELDLQTTAGLHTGEIELRPGDVAGLAVNLAARVQARAQPMEILVSEAVRHLTPGSGIRYEDLGLHPLKGIPGQTRLFRVASTAASNEATVTD